MEIHYNDYLQLDKILAAQQPESFKPGSLPAHDEMLFIIIHQTYELWFKQILFELDAVLSTMQQPVLNDNAADLQTVVHRLKRVVTILKILVQQIDIIETMTPLDFLDFRDMLRPASGFQSTQFKMIEAKLGLRFEQRHCLHHYTDQLNTAEVTTIKSTEKNTSLVQLINLWLQRMPFTAHHNFEALKEDNLLNKPTNFLSAYQTVYEKSLANGEENNKEHFKNIFYDSPQNKDRQLSAKACENALFILLYRGYPMLELPFQLLETLLEIDNQLGNWRHRHINMVQRMIGTRIGTGGSSGAGYLKGAMENHAIFKEIATLNSFLIDRRKLPSLPKELTEMLSYTF